MVSKFPSNSYREGNKGIFFSFSGQASPIKQQQQQHKKQGVVCESGTAERDPLGTVPHMSQPLSREEKTSLGRESRAGTMHLACLEKPSNLRSGHFWNARPRGAAGAARMRMGFVTRCHRCAPVLLQCLCCPRLQEEPPGLPAALQQDVPLCQDAGDELVEAL